MIIYFKQKAKKWNKFMFWFGLATVVTGAVSVYFFLKARNQYKKLLFKRKMSLAEKNHEEIPYDETCIVCLDQRRSVILLPCRHFICC